MKSFCKDFKEHVTKTIGYEKKEMIPLTIEEKKSYRKLKNLSYMQKRIQYR